MRENWGKMGKNGCPKLRNTYLLKFLLEFTPNYSRNYTRRTKFTVSKRNPKIAKSLVD